MDNVYFTVSLTFIHHESVGVDELARSSFNLDRLGICNTLNLGNKYVQMNENSDCVLPQTIISSVKICIVFNQEL